MKKERIGLFGGTFNPIHFGHLKAAESVQKKFSLNRVLFIPSYIPPYKESAEIAPACDRLKMAELALQNCPQFISSSMEIEARGKSYSILTIEKIKKTYSNAWIFFILGVDAFLEIDTWKDYKRVLEECLFIVTTRPGYILEEAKNVLSGKYSERVYPSPLPPKIEDELFMNYKIFLCPIEALDISSTEIRRKVKKHLSLKGLVPERVESYIQEHRLYQK
jgi:nicotinate-nucleotide adenylyltransferase